MHIHIFLHVHFEGPGCIEDWIKLHGHQATVTRWYEHPAVPDMTNTSLLIVMGGPMGIYDEKDHPWLKAEKTCIDTVISAGKPVLGICLGAQLIAGVLGAKVYANTCKEIGWFPVTFSTGHIPAALAALLPEQQTVFHWHGDTFNLPENAVCFASTPATTNQAFLYGNRVIGLQYHFEVTPSSMEAMVLHGRHELITDTYVQDAGTILGIQQFIKDNNTVMYRLLDYLSHDIQE